MINLQYSTIQNDIPPFIYEGMRSFVTQSNVYHPQSPELISKLSKKHNISSDHLFISAGSDESINIIKQAFNLTTSYFPPTYIEYAKTYKAICRPARVLDTDGYSIDTSTVDENGLIFLANPNNPYGITAKDKVMELVKNNPESIVVVDEAYSSFSRESVIDKVQEHSNLIVLRSFSKDYAMAGMRVGYIVAHPSILMVLSKYSQETNVSYASVGAALAGLSHQAYYDGLVAGIIKRRDDFSAFLKTKGLFSIASNINVVILKLATSQESQALFEYLRGHDVITSYGNGRSNVGLSDSHIRVTVGNENQMKLLKDLLSNYIGG